MTNNTERGLFREAENKLRSGDQGLGLADDEGAPGTDSQF